MFSPNRFSAARPRASALILSLVLMMVLGMIILFSLRAAQQDTHAVHRDILQLQGRYIAEGAINRAKTDVLCQVAATAFLGDVFETIAVKYGRLDARFNVPGKRIPGDLADGAIDWTSPQVASMAMWDFVGDAALDQPGFDDWAGYSGTVASGDVSSTPTARMGDVRVYVTRARLDTDGSTATGSAGSYGITLTAAAVVREGGQRSTFVLSKSYEHQLGFPQLFNYLMLGNRLSDCSMCHLKVYGDIGQVKADDPLQLPIWAVAQPKTFMQIWGSIHTNSNFTRRDNATYIERGGRGREENNLKSPGVSGTQDEKGLTYPGMHVYSNNGSLLADWWKDENPSADPAQNPFRPIKSLSTPLPSSWPSVKDNLLDWFEPRSRAAATSGESLLTVEPRDNNLVKNYQPVQLSGANAGEPDLSLAKVSYGAGSSVYNTAIDRVMGPGLSSVAAENADKIVAYNAGLHPADDLDGDTVPNGFDADIDGDGMVESPRASDDPNDPAYELTSAELATHYALDSQTGKRQWTLGRKWDAVHSTWVRDTASGADYRTLNEAQINDQRLAAVYKDMSSGGTRRYAWDAAVTGVGTSLANIIGNKFARTPGDSDGVIRGIFPTDARLADGNPDYDANGGERNLMILGSEKNPIQITGQVVVRGDALVTGHVSGTGAVITHRNIYIPQDLRYKNEPDWSLGKEAKGDQLGLVAGGNVVIGNVLQNVNNSLSDLMGFVWGNMVNVNDPAISYNFWGYDSKTSAMNHMVNPTYLMDGADGGKWIGGKWVTENAGNTVAEVFNAQGMRISGGLDPMSSAFNPNRRHLNFSGDSNSKTKLDSQSTYKGFYISTPGLLPLGSSLMTSMPADWPSYQPVPPGTTFYGSIAGTPWFNTSDFKFLTQVPKAGVSWNAKAGSYDALGAWTNGIGPEIVGDKTIRFIDAVLYSDHAVVGGNLPKPNADGRSTDFLAFRGTVIARDVQIISAIGSPDAKEGLSDETASQVMFNNSVGSLYYDWRLRGTVNPLNFPYSEGYVGGEMAMTGLPPLVTADGKPGKGSRDNWIPFRLTQAYKDQIEKD